MDITNPVLRGMYPDPSWMWDERGERVALVNSSFELVPGLPFHVSVDIANWALAGNAVDEATPQRLLISFVPASGGLYAPTLRMIRGKYVIACTVARIALDAADAAGEDP
ncbi:family 43 glycosylhydrolase, partial [Bifidobacterium longum]|uniref:family 43 glycosylhydrolase n=1 Tax=Bifidobacterium longum TaxID=216816 RepID=UPI0011783ABE